MVRFGLFVFDPRSGDLRKQGRKIRLEGQPVQVLVKLLERPGELVTREELQKELWPADIYVNFEHGLNAAVKRLRRALNDSPARPVFIETLSRRGYRFIAPVISTGHPIGHTLPHPHLTDLAVLPFENLSGDPAADYLGEGIAEAVIHTLSRLPAVRVMARSAAFRFRGANLDPQMIGRKLNVRAVLLGRVGQRGDSLTIGAELVDVRNGFQIWGGQYNRKLSEIQAVEEEMTREMCDSLRLRLNGEEGGRVFRHFTENTEAYQEYLKGRFHWNRLNEGSVRRSLEYYQNAIGQDPNYALAYAGLADSYALLGFFGVERPADLVPKAKQAALQALALDDRLSEAHCALAGILKIYEWDWEGSERAYEQALRLDSKNWQAHRGYAALLAARGRTNAAMREIQSAHELDPLSLSLNMEIAWNLYIARRYDDAIRQATRTLEMEAQFFPALHALGLAYEETGRYQEARAAHERAVSGSGNPTATAALARVAALMGDTEAARRLLAELLALHHRSYVLPYLPALIYAGLGEYEEALTWLDRGFDDRDPYLVWIGMDPRFDRLRDQPRFRNLVERIERGAARSGGATLERGSAASGK